MNLLIPFVVAAVCLITAPGCSTDRNLARQIEDGYELPAGTSFKVVLQSSLGCNTNSRGDSFSTRLKNPFLAKDKTILPAGTEITGLVNRVTRYEKLGDRASLLLLFDQLILADGTQIPISASLDTLVVAIQDRVLI